MIPVLPTSFFPRPFANNGTYQVIPDDKVTDGRASFKEGFPTETQLPLSAGGVAPSRPDFNGILYMLSAMAFWQQSGGQWVYSATLDYNTPAIVFHNGILWWCKSPNGSSTTTPGAVEPGTNSDYWIDFPTFLSGSGGGSIGNPVGTVIMFYGISAPVGYLACDGATFSATEYPLLYALLGSTTLPDFSGLVPRAYDPTAKNDPDGATRTIGSKQDDAIRNITGLVSGTATSNNSFLGDSVSADGAFYLVGAGTKYGIPDLSPIVYGCQSFNLDASRVVPTAEENRMKNFSILYCIKHD